MRICDPSLWQSEAKSKALICVCAWLNCGPQYTILHFHSRQRTHIFRPKSNDSPWFVLAFGFISAALTQQYPQLNKIVSSCAFDSVQFLLRRPNRTDYIQWNIARACLGLKEMIRAQTSLAQTKWTHQILTITDTDGREVTFRHFWSVFVKSDQKVY